MAQEKKTAAKAAQKEKVVSQPSDNERAATTLDYMNAQLDDVLGPGIPPPEERTSHVEGTGGEEPKGVITPPLSPDPDSPPWAKEDVVPVDAQVPAVVAPATIEHLMELAIHNGGEQVLEILERLTALKNAQEDREAKMIFAEHFAKMQSEFVAVRKTKAGYNYKYATLGKLIEHFGPAIADNGFSHWFEGEMLEEPKGWKRVTLHITGWGHERTNHFDVPPIEQTNSMTDVQALGSADTYGERYTFVAGYVLPILDEEDTDGAILTPDEMEDLTAAIKELERAETYEKLRTVFSLHYKAAKTDLARGMLMDAKDQQKAVLKEIEDAATKS